MSDEKKIIGAKLQAGAVVASGVAGAIMKRQLNPSRNTRGRTAVQVGSAIGAAAANGAGVSGSVGAGVAVLTAKVAAGAAAATAAAPFIAGGLVVGGIGYGLYRLFK